MYVEVFLAGTGFVLGGVVGSFLNVLVLRGQKGESLQGRSYCPNCKHQLAWSDNLPLFSFIFLGGKCRYCQKPISWQYPLVELTTALAFALIFLAAAAKLSFEGPTFGWNLQLVFSAFFTSVLISVSIADFKWGIIPDRIILPSIVAAFIFQIVAFVFAITSFQFFVASVFTALGLGLFFLTLILITRGRGMGVGDLKLVIFIGLCLSWQSALVGVLLGFLTGALVAVMLLLRGKKKLKQTIAFGPFLALGAFVASLFGDKLADLYLKTLGL